MRMSVKQLRAFLAVAHTLNFAHASERLNLSQPALSLTIKGLEEALGGALLQRSTRKVTLTREGNSFCRWPVSCWPTGITSRRPCVRALPCSGVKFRSPRCRRLPPTFCRRR